MLDRYFFSTVQRISPEAPVPVAKVERQSETLGGAGNVAHNLARLGCQVSLIGITGQDENQRTLVKLLNYLNINSTGLIATDRPTTTKLRIIGGHQQMIRLDFEETEMFPLELNKTVKAAFTREVPGVNAVIISDYAKGLCTQEFCQYIIKQCANLNIPIIIDPKGINWRKYRGANFVTPNLKELNEVAALRKPVTNDDSSVKTAAELVRKRYDIANVVVTRSEKGFSLVGADTCVHVPTQAREVFDVSGAGDTFIAVLGAAISAKLSAIDAAYLANLAAGVVVGRAGTYAISREELLEAYNLNQ